MPSNSNTGIETPLTIRFFSVLRELTGRRCLEMPLREPEEVATVLDRLVADYPVMAPYRMTMRAAVNREYVDESFTVYNGDELAIVTPVSGG